MAYAYLLRCSDGSFYAGSTHHLEQRLAENNSDDLGAAYTRRRRPVTLVWSAWFDSIAEAYAFEKQIQGWSRAKREALIRGDYDALYGLSRRGHAFGSVAEYVFRLTWFSRRSQSDRTSTTS